MKLATIIAALLAATTTQAGVFAVIPNDAGGAIELFDEACTGGKPGNLAMVEVTNSEQMLIGCWHNTDDYIIVEWSFGATRRYTKDNVMVTPYGQQQYGDKEQVKPEVQL